MLWNVNETTVNISVYLKDTRRIHQYLSAYYIFLLIKENGILTDCGIITITANMKAERIATSDWHKNPNKMSYSKLPNVLKSTGDKHCFHPSEVRKRVESGETENYGKQNHEELNYLCCVISVFLH